MDARCHQLSDERAFPPPTDRLAFREMTRGDQEIMEELLGDPEVMRYYPRPKSRDEVSRWIDSTLRSYDEHGHALWVLELIDTGEFIGDCGLTWQNVDGNRMLEVGYRLLPRFQGVGYATEAAAACLRFAHEKLGEDHVVAIINPDNWASRALAERLGMRVEQETTTADGRPIVVYGMRAIPD